MTAPIPPLVDGPERASRADEDTRPALDEAAFDKTLFEALLDARAVAGGGRIVVEDIERQPLSYDKLVLAAMVLGGRLNAITDPGEHVGVFLPNSVGVAATFFALQAFGRVPAMLNFSAGIRNVEAACAAGEVRTILTSRRFVELAKLESYIEAFAKTRQIVWLDDIKASLTLKDKLTGLIRSKTARRVHGRRRVSPGDIAVLLFTSGTEGLPKGVALTHRNMLANCHQADITFELEESDRVFNPLPVFHSFGLMAGMILPIVRRLPTFLYPSPLHYRQIPPLVNKFDATILFGTDTFLTGYGRAATPEDFSTLRLVVAGAERVKEHTRELWTEKFNLPIFEGYGTTETSPVLAVNTHRYFRPGTVGRLFPGIDHRLEPVQGLDEGGRLIVRGPNVMAGYLTADAPGQLKPPPERWYDTGDIVTVDAQGFVTIRGRAKRFAKIGGEMVSLAAIEAYAAEVWPDNAHAVVTLADERRGEQMILVTDCGEACRDSLLAWAKAHGVSELMIPKKVVPVEALPVLGTGKLDYVGINEIAAG